MAPIIIIYCSTKQFNHWFEIVLHRIWPIWSISNIHHLKQCGGAASSFSDEFHLDLANNRLPEASWTNNRHEQIGDMLFRAKPPNAIPIDRKHSRVSGVICDILGPASNTHIAREPQLHCCCCHRRLLSIAVQIALDSCHDEPFSGTDYQPKGSALNYICRDKVYAETLVQKVVPDGVFHRPAGSSRFWGHGLSQVLRRSRS